MACREHAKNRGMCVNLLTCVLDTPPHLTPLLVGYSSRVCVLFLILLLLTITNTTAFQHSTGRRLSLQDCRLWIGSFLGPGRRGRSSRFRHDRLRRYKVYILPSVVAMQTNQIRLKFTFHFIL